MLLTVPVAHKEIANKGEQQQDDCEAQLELLIFIFVSKPDKEEYDIFRTVHTEQMIIMLEMYHFGEIKNILRLFRVLI